MICKLKPVYKNYIWGGTRLIREYGKQCGMETVAESWELFGDSEAIYPSRLGGEIGKACRENWGENCRECAEFPLLIKLIDAEQNLSVQVHPDDAYAYEQEQSMGKTEAWYIVDAEPGAGIYLGFSRDVTEEEVRVAVADGTLCELMNFFSVKRGQSYLIPAGTVHAIGAGCLICEIQQNSNLTYRLFDYGRRDPNGLLRELHVEKALRVLCYKKYEKPAPFEWCDGEELLASCRYFRMTRLRTNGEATLQIGKESFCAITCVRGDGNADGQEIHTGDSFFIPAGHGAVRLEGSMELICTRAGE